MLWVGSRWTIHTRISCAAPQLWTQQVRLWATPVTHQPAKNTDHNRARPLQSRRQANMQHLSHLHRTHEATNSSSWARRVVLGVLAFEGLGALWGGPLLVFAPNGSIMNMPTEILRGIFADFLVPGLVLTGLGVLNVAAFVVVLLRRPSSLLWASLALGGFFIWFVVEFYIVGYGHVAQVIWGVPVLIGGAAKFFAFCGDEENHPLRQ